MNVYNNEEENKDIIIDSFVFLWRAHLRGTTCEVWEINRLRVNYKIINCSTRTYHTNQ